MRHLFRHKEHLFRMAVLFLGGTLLFIILRAVMVPRDFGVYGHFRAGALDDNRAVPLQYAGRAACADCHPDVVEARVGGKHEGIGCEACHGALAAHAESRMEEKPTLPDTRTTCLQCHQKKRVSARRGSQIVPANLQPRGRVRRVTWRTRRGLS
jgi:hypothetical protein